MNTVTFPGLGLTFNFSKVAFTLFGIEVYKYAVCIVLGIVAALILGKLSKEKFEIDYTFAVESCIIAIIFGTIGARLYYVLFNLEYYSKNIGEIFAFRNGGLAIYGGLIFGGLATLIYTKIRKVDTLNFFDYVVPFIALSQFFGRFGNFFNIESYGYETTSLLRMGITTVEGYIEVHPMFLYEAIVNIAIFIFLIIMQKRRKFKGEIVLLYCMLYSGFRAILEGYRADSLMFYSLRASQVLSVIIFVTSLILLIVNFRKNNKVEVKEESKEEN